MIRIAFSAAVLTISLAACAATPPSSGAESGPVTGDSTPPVQAGGSLCDAGKAQAAVGQAASAEAIEKARVDAGAGVARVLKPGQMVTMEFRADRLNIDVDDNNNVKTVRCG